MQLNRLVVDLHSLDEGIDGLVGLLVEEEIQTGQIGPGQRPRLFDQMLDVDARRQPAERKEQRKRQQPPEFEFHGINSSPGGPRHAKWGGSCSCRQTPAHPDAPAGDRSRGADDTG